MANHCAQAAPGPCERQLGEAAWAVGGQGGDSTAGHPWRGSTMSALQPALGTGRQPIADKDASCWQCNASCSGMHTSHSII